jgi:hypothetical protein
MSTANIYHGGSENSRSNWNTESSSIGATAKGLITSINKSDGAGDFLDTGIALSDNEALSLAEFFLKARGSTSPYIRFLGSSATETLKIGTSASADHIIIADSTNTFMLAVSTGDPLSSPGQTIAKINTDIMSLITREYLETVIPSGGITTEVMKAANLYNCNQIGGFVNKFNAQKVLCNRTGLCKQITGYIYNAYGSRQIEFGLYDYTGNLLGRSGIITVPSGENVAVPAPLITPVTVTENTGYWLGFWGNGVDVPEFLSFFNYDSVFPTGMHSIEDSTALTLPLTFNSSSPFAATRDTYPVSAII